MAVLFLGAGIAEAVLMFRSRHAGARLFLHLI